jgi:hypothetical protein
MKCDVCGEGMTHDMNGWVCENMACASNQPLMPPAPPTTVIKDYGNWCPGCGRRMERWDMSLSGWLCGGCGYAGKPVVKGTDTEYSCVMVCGVCAHEPCVCDKPIFPPELHPYQAAVMESACPHCLEPLKWTMDGWDKCPCGGYGLKVAEFQLPHGMAAELLPFQDQLSECLNKAIDDAKAKQAAATVKPAWNQARVRELADRMYEVRRAFQAAGGVGTPVMVLPVRNQEERHRLQNEIFAYLGCLKDFQDFADDEAVRVSFFNFQGVSIALVQC